MSKKKDDIHFYADITAIISLAAIVIFFFWEQNNMNILEEENQRILLKVFTNEIDVNIEISNNITSNSKKLLESGEWPHFRYSTIVLKQVISYGKIRDENLTKQIWRIYSYTDQANRIFDELSIFIPLTQEQCISFNKLKKERASQILLFNELIKKELLDLKPQIEIEINKLK